jgi:DNA-binding NtrC family response regulator
MLVLDMIMEPGMDGLDAYKEIIKICPAQKAIIATGYSTSERIKHAQALGAGACLKKPYVMEDLARAVREELDR